MYAGYEHNHKENKVVGEKHLDTMLRDFEGELRMLED
jgi:hypothetical protein